MRRCVHCCDAPPQPPGLCWREVRGLAQPGPRTAPTCRPPRAGTVFPGAITITSQATGHPADDEGDDARDDADDSAGPGDLEDDRAASDPVQLQRALRAATLHAPAHLLADRVCAAAAVLSQLDGVALTAAHAPSMLVPVGASGPMAAAVEHAELTAGEGPIRHTHLSGEDGLLLDVTDPEDGGRLRWPTWAVLLVRATPYRSVLTVPLPHPAEPPRAPLASSAPWWTPLVLSCYRRTPLSTPRTPIKNAVDSIATAQVAAQQLATAISSVLAQATAAAGDRPDWLDSRRVLRRSDVWRAEELLITADPLLHRTHALAALRMYALVHGELLEEVAAALLKGQIAAADVRGRCT